MIRFIVLEGFLESVACESDTFFAYIPLGFANCQLVLYISNVGKRPIAFCLKMLMNVNGFANSQPFLYI